MTRTVQRKPVSLQLFIIIRKCAASILCECTCLDHPQHTAITVIKNQHAALASNYKVPFRIKRNRSPAGTLFIA